MLRRRRRKTIHLVIRKRITNNTVISSRNFLPPTDSAMTFFFSDHHRTDPKSSRACWLFIPWPVHGWLYTSYFFLCIFFFLGGGREGEVTNPSPFKKMVSTFQLSLIKKNDSSSGSCLPPMGAELTAGMSCPVTSWSGTPEEKRNTTINQLFNFVVRNLSQSSPILNHPCSFLVCYLLFLVFPRFEGSLYITKK